MLKTSTHSKDKDEYMWAMEKEKRMTKKARKDMIVPEQMMVRTEEVDHEYVFLFCSSQVGSPLVSMLYVL